MENNHKKKKRLPIFYYLFLVLVLICAIAIITLLRRTERNLTEMATAAGQGVELDQISDTTEFEIELLFSSFEFQADVKGTNTARYYLEYAITNHSEEAVEWTPPHLEYLVEETWYLADSARDLSEIMADPSATTLESVASISPISYSDEVFKDHLSGEPLSPGERRHGMIYLDTITGVGTDDSPEYTNVFWPGPYRIVFETGSDTYATLTFELPENAMDLSHQFLTDPWDVIYYEGAPSSIPSANLVPAGAKGPSLYGLSYREVLLVSRGSSLCWEMEYRKPYRTYTLTFQGEGATDPIHLEFLRNTDWYPIPANELSTLEAKDGYFHFTLYPAQDRSKDVHTDSQKFRTGMYRLLLPTEGKWTSIEFLLE